MLRLHTLRHPVKGAAALVCIVAATTAALAQDVVTQDTANGNDSRPRDVAEATQRAMLEMQYADEQGCFMISNDEVRPVMPLLVSSDGLPGVVHEHVITALDDALSRGCDINQPDLIGLSPLNTAIVQSNAALTRYLLDHGADPALTISSGRAEIDGLNSITLLDLLSERAPENEAKWQEIREMIVRTDDAAQ